MFRKRLNAVTNLSRGRDKGAYNDDWWHRRQTRDLVFLNILQHLNKIEFLHDVYGNPSLGSNCNKYRLRHRVVHG
jgi:hypothetical protein